MRQDSRTAEDLVLAPGRPIARGLRAGQVLRVTDLEGQQVGDLVAFARGDLSEKFWISNTIRLNGTVYLTVGHVLYSELNLRAEMDLLIALSNCPQDLNPCNAGRLTPLGFTVYEPEKPHA